MHIRPSVKINHQSILATHPVSSQIYRHSANWHPSMLLKSRVHDSGEFDCISSTGEVIFRHYIDNCGQKH